MGWLLKNLPTILTAVQAIAKLVKGKGKRG